MFGAAATGTATTQLRKTCVPNNALPIGTHLSEFEIVDLVGEGGFGIVYLADDHSLQRRVAVKEYMPSSLASRGDDSSVVVRSERHLETFEIGRRSFVNEARLLAQFDHPALVKVFRFWEANGTAYMAMPFYAGKTLRDVLKESPQAPDENWIRKILAPLMDALELIHAEGCFHRDVAPDNIMLLTDDRPVLLDFGAARRVISDMTQALTVILKPGFAPIEQYADMPGVKQGPWTDIYALAAVVHYMITSRTPPPSVNRIMQDNYEPLAIVAAGRYSDRFLHGIDQCLAVKSEDRPQSIAEMRQLLGHNDDGVLAAMLAVSDKSEYQPLTGEFEQTQQATRISSAIQPPGTAAPPRKAASAVTARPRVSQYIGGGILVGLIATASYYYFTGEEVPPTPAPPAQPAPAPAAQATPAAVAPAAEASDKPAEPPKAAEHPAAPPPLRSIPLEDAFAATVAGSGHDFALSIDGIKTPLTIAHDPLSFVLQSARGGYLYVLLWDKAAEQLSQIFPNALDKDNRIVAGRPVKFPRPAWAYEADPPMGPWSVMVIVSESPRHFPYLTGTEADGAIGARQEIAEKALADMGSGGTALTGETRCPAGQGCSQAYAAVSFVVEEAVPTATNPAPGKKASSARPPATRDKADKDSPQGLDKILEEMLKAR